MMPYWMTSTLAATPALLWMFAGVGLPWALVSLPRRDWADRVLVACLTLAFGPALVTGWMLLVGMIPQANLLRLDVVLLGTGVLALAGWGIVWRRRGSLSAHPLPQATARLNGLERLLIGLVGIALVVRWLGVAYWPSTAYDALWVYAYEGKLFTLLGHIPTRIDYYPLFLPLQHTFLQLAVGGVDDHAARAVLPWLHLGSILAVYVLGNRLFNRRTGIIAAAIWALYPHMAEWSRYGDLEVPVTFMFTGAAAFFTLAWTADQPDTQPFRRRYAVIAGLFLGIGMWTKPTMGAFIYGVALVSLIGLLHSLWQARQRGERFSWRTLQPRAEVVVLTGLCSIPLGAVWYVRNLVLGHTVIVLPDGFWQSLAAQSGVEFGWPLLALLLLLAWVWWQNLTRPGEHRLSTRWLISGVVILLLGLLPSIIYSGRIDIGANRMGVVEWLLLFAGSGLVFSVLWRYASQQWTAAGWNTTRMVGWLLALALPYFVTWFFSYSYHYRLSFAIVPLLIIPSAVILEAFTRQAILWRYRQLARVAMIGLSLSGIVNPLYDPNAGWDWLWTDKLPDDHARYTSGNQAFMNVVDGLQIYLNENPGQPLKVVAPQIRRLPFFFPLEDIDIKTMPQRLDELEGVTYFIYGKPESGGDFNTFKAGENQVLSALSLATSGLEVGNWPMRRAWGEDDGIFKYSVYELHLDNRFKQPYIHAPTTEGDVVFGDFVRLLGHDIGGLDFWPGRELIMHLYWEVIKTPSADYMIYIHLREADGNVVQSWDGPVTLTRDGNYYSTLVWEPGEIVIDERTLLFEGEDVPTGAGYQIVVGLYDLATDTRVPLTINGQAAGEGYRLTDRIQIVPPPSS